MLEKAQKIWIDTPLVLNVYADFSESFTVTDPAVPVMLAISADSHYAVTVNGEAVNGNQFADFPDYKVYDTVDITSLIHVGKNELLVTGYCQGESSLVYRAGEAGVLFEVRQGEEVLCYSNAETPCRLHAGYRSGEIERITDQLSFSFRYDAVAADTPQPWQRCVVREGYDALYPRPCAPLRLEERVPATIAAQGILYKPQDESLPCGEYMKQTALCSLLPKEMGFDMAHTTLPSAEGITLQNDGGDGVFVVVDLLKETAGLLDIEFTVPHEAEIYVGFGEHLDQLRVMTSVDGRQFAIVYRAKAGHNRFVHRFKRLAGRYLQIHFPSKTAAVHYIGLQPTVYPVTDCGGLVCDDQLHSRIYEVAKHTLQLCMHEHYEDCPWREQALYGMDSRVEMLCAYRAFKEYDLAKASLRLFAHSQRENGQLELCAPAWAPIYIPSFNLCYVVGCADYLVHTGDVAFMQEIYPVLRRLIQAFAAKQTASGVIACFTEPEAWNFYEWAPGLDGRPKKLWPSDCKAEFVEENSGEWVSAPLNAYFVMALKAYVTISRAVGCDDEAQRATTLQQTIVKAAERLFWNADKACYASYYGNGQHRHYAELTQALFLCADMVPSEKQQALRRQLCEGNEHWVPMTVGSLFHKYAALMQDGNTYADAVFDEIATRWGNMLTAGATSFWETFSGASEYTFGGAGSLCHGWAALPIYVYYTYGVDTGRAGFTMQK